MKKKELKDLKSKDMAGLEKILAEKRKESLTKSNKNLRREIAQILTVVREKEIIGKITKE